VCLRSQQGWWKWLSGVIDNSLYAVLFLDYSKAVVPALGSGLGRVIALNVIVFVSLRHLYTAERSSEQHNFPQAMSQTALQ
jgi:hypothetical protein